ncbi:MAG TPA: N-acyl homoserine lactonase family protein [Gammaproteobacteria bacterium]|jgi:glyoxylase-like metal-dependent hydrolase (beta-lactamase superfamily II)|nr:N-acyl homoserine lactonase family protein [Gammaproteobacteria bacterium]
MSLQRLMAVGVLGIALSVAGLAQSRPKPPATPRIYVFENGAIKGLDPALFNFKREELKEADFVDASYLIVHPRGTLMFDSGTVPDSHFKGDGKPVVEGVVSATRPLLPQLASTGYTVADIDYFAMSHYHSDHTANANAFAKSTWIVQKAERDFMFGDKPAGIVQPATYEALRTARTKVLDGEDFDVFGDGTVVIMSTPGHTPGHQVVAVKLANAGTIVLGGDLYHYPEERTTGRTPTFEFDAEQSKASRARIEKFLKDTHGTLWIEHDKATLAALPKAPKYVD